MEENKTIFNDLQVNFVGSQQLTETSRWAKFLAILFISLAGIFAFLLLFAWNRISAAIETTTDNSSALVLTIFVIVCVAVVVVVVLMFFLIRAMNRIKTSLRTKDQNLFNSGLGDLKTYFTIYGVIGILLLILKLIGFFA